jgi:hypothetical protein
MPSRKQRRRREKTFRHEYGWVVPDEEGNETEVAKLAELREKKDKPAKLKAQAASGGKQRRTTREPTPPSWRRSFRRGGLWGGVMMVTVIFFFQGTPLAARIAWGAMYALAFIPLTYWIDRMAYRSYLRRIAKNR